MFTRNFVSNVYIALAVGACIFLAAIAILYAGRNNNEGVAYAAPIRASATVAIVVCPEDATNIGGTCIPLDNWGVCHRLQVHASRVYRADDMRNTPRVRVAFRMRDIGCNWQRNFSGAIR